MQRTIYDQTMTPGVARAIRPALAAQYPPRSHETTVLDMRVPPKGLKRVRIVIQLKARRGGR